MKSVHKKGRLTPQVQMTRAKGAKFNCPSLKKHHLCPAGHGKIFAPGELNIYKRVNILSKCSK